MREREIFRIIVRTIGLALWAAGLANAFASLLIWLKLSAIHYYTAADRAGAALAYFLSGLAFNGGDDVCRAPRIGLPRSRRNDSTHPSSE